MIYRLYLDDYHTNYKLLKIEQAQHEDIDELLALQKRAYQSEAALVNDYNIEPLTQPVEDVREEFRRGTMLKASIINEKKTSNEEGLGAIIIGSVRAHMRENICYVGKLFVEPAYQNMGIGSLLMKHIESFFPNVLRFELFTGERSRKNIVLYRKLGYNLCKTEELSGALSLVYFEKLNPSICCVHK